MSLISTSIAPYTSIYSGDIDNSKQQIIDRIKIASSINLENLRRVHLPKWDVKKGLAERYGFHPLEYVLALGTTLGGPNTVARLLTKLSPTLPAAVVVVQEISPKIISSFVEKFDQHVPWKVEVARNDMVLEQGTCYVNSNEKSLSLEENSKGEPCLKYGHGKDRPLNLLFTSASKIFRQNTIGVLLTGIGDDGAEGFRKIRDQSGVTIAQDTECCVYPNLTNNAIQKETVDWVVNESKLPGVIESVMS